MEKRGPAMKVVERGDVALMLIRKKYEIHAHNGFVRVRPMCARVLRYLMEREGCAVPKECLYRDVWTPPRPNRRWLISTYAYFVDIFGVSTCLCHTTFKQCLVLDIGLCRILMSHLRKFPRGIVRKNLAEKETPAFLTECTISILRIGKCRSAGVK